MGGDSKKRLPRIEREQILNAYSAGREAVVSLFEYLQETLLAVIEEHEARIEELEERINKDSHNSNKLPSSDAPKRKFTKKREPSDKKPGSQEGHEGTTLRMVKHPTYVEVHEVKQCGSCGRSLKDVKRVGKIRIDHHEVPTAAHSEPGLAEPVNGNVPRTWLPDQSSGKGGLQGQLFHFDHQTNIPYKRCEAAALDSESLATARAVLEKTAEIIDIAEVGTPLVIREDAASCCPSRSVTRPVT